MIVQLRQAMADFLQQSPLNVVEELGNMRIYDAPLVGVASPEDPLFDTLKEEHVVGPHHLSPKVWLPEAGSVISYFLPFTSDVREANRTEGLPASQWLYARYEGEIVNNAMRRFVVEWFQQQGYQAVCPVLDGRFAVAGRRRSNWSERHVAFIAGLGTFSLNRSLITSRGSAGRLGSAVVSARLQPTSRPYRKYDEYCTQCGACIHRCPPEAITEQGKDNDLCSAYLDAVLEQFHPRYGCGKCQTNLPCEDRIPGRE